MLLPILPLLAQFAAYPGITPAQIAQLKKTRQDVFLPTYIPAGMRGQVNVELSSQRDRVSYFVTYRKGKQEFTVQTASEGIGDIFLEEDEGATVVVRNAEFGKLEAVFAKRKNGPFVVNWVERPKQWPTYVGFLGDELAPSTVKRILASVRKI